MAKARRVRDKGQEKALTKKQIARSKKVMRQQRMVWLGVASVTALVLIVLAIGIVQEFILAPRQPVAIVNGEEISTAEYQKRVSYSQWYLERLENNLLLEQARYDPNDESQQFLYQYIGAQIQQYQQEWANVPSQALQDLIGEALIRQEAARRGLTVSDDEVQLAIEQQFGYDRNPPEPTATPITTTAVLTPTTPVAPMTKEEFDQSYSEFLDLIRSEVQGFSEKDLRNITEQSLLREKLNEALAAEVPTTDEHVHAYHILVDEEEVAAEVLEKLNAGESFADLVTEYSQDQDTVETGGELGWLAQDQVGFNPTLVEAALALQPGEISEVIETYLGFHILTVDERQSDYPLDEATLESRQSRAVVEWLSQARETATIEEILTPEEVPEEQG
jgi:parvulin-like peptidyl-prolyl isomerase